MLQHQCIHVLIFSLSVIGKVASAAMVVCLNYVDKFELSIDSILFSKELYPFQEDLQRQIISMR